MIFAYADPPYIGQAQKHYSNDPDCAEVDHAELIRRLMQYGGWALSASSTSLWTIARLMDDKGFVIPEDARIGAWIKPFCSFKPNVNPAYAWEPVIFWGGRKRGRSLPTIRDWLSESITLKKGLSGVKPVNFSFWMFQILGARSDDTFVDLFPGSGAVAEAWDSYRRQCRPAPCGGEAKPRLQPRLIQE